MGLKMAKSDYRASNPYPDLEECSLVGCRANSAVREGPGEVQSEQGKKFPIQAVEIPTINFFPFPPSFPFYSVER
jgi:hypothetical protein